jgi:curved DNA-binding protein CbpA
MSDSPRLSNNEDPLQVLGLPRHASEHDVRRRYLELVRAHPPERDPARFQQIHAAYKAAEDPLVLAQRLLDYDDEPPRPWSEILEEQKANPPRLKVDVLLSLGNRRSGTPSSSGETADE